MPSKKLTKKRPKTTLNKHNANQLALATGASSGIGKSWPSTLLNAMDAATHPMSASRTTPKRLVRKLCGLFGRNSL
jgi:hypothetical protein